MTLERVKELLKENDECLNNDLVHLIHTQCKEYREAYDNIYSKIMNMNDESEKEEHDKLYDKLLDDIIPYTYLGIVEADEELIICNGATQSTLLIYVPDKYYVQYRNMIPYSLYGFPILVKKLSVCG
jgi:hypothetical protein